MKNIPFNGILAVGDTQRQATDNYRRLALGQDVAAFRDEGGSLSFISNSSSAPNVMFNPKTGDVDVVRDDSIISQVSFASESSDEEVYPHHAVCSDGCGKHVVYDSVSSVQFCPMCTCSLAPASESGEDCTDDDGNQMNDESELESESESAAEDEAMELLDGIEDDEDAAEDEGEDLESESADDEDDGGEDPEEEPEDDDEDDLSDLDDEDDELDGEEDDGETSESSDGDGVVCASASKASAIKMFLKESNTSLSADQTVGVEYVVCSSDSCGAHIVHNTASLTACPVCLSSVEEPEGELDGELDLDAEDEGHDFDMEDDDLESESADDGDDGDDDLSDLDLDDGEDGEDDEDSEDDEDAADTDGDSPSESSDSMTTKTAVSFSRAGAQARYVQINGLGSSLSADATVEAEYVVCSSDSCGAHIVSESRAEFCPVCASETVDPDTSEDESSVAEEKPEEEVETTGADKAAEIMGNLGAEEKPEADKPAAAEGDAPDAGAEEKSEEDEMDASESTDIDALALVDDSQPDAAAKLDVSYSSNVAGASAWTAFYEGKPVAMARVADAGKNADLFDKPAFGQAALSAARQIGVKTVLRDLGFKPLVHSVPVTTSLSKMVEERVAAERESLSATAKQHSERFQAALATAAIGINRGFFKGVANPLKSALCSAMADAGMRNPEALVDSVFSRNFEQFSKIAHAKAEEILQRPPEVQESLASAVLDVCYKSESSSQDGAGLESKLSSIGVSVSSGAGAIQNNNKQQPVVTAGPQVSTSSSFDEDLSLALGTLGATRR